MLMNIESGTCVGRIDAVSSHAGYSWVAWFVRSDDGSCDVMRGFHTDLSAYTHVAIVCPD